MKRIFISFLFLCVTYLPAQCPTLNQNGGLYINSQSALNEFNNYPNCTEFHGNLFIEGVDDSDDPIISLLPLQNLTEARGIFHIGNTDIINMEGLNNLSRAGYFRIFLNDELEFLHGLENLVSTLHLEIASNPKIINMEGLNNLQRIVIYASFKENQHLINFKGLENLVDGPFDTFYVYKNPNLISMEGLTNLVDLDYLLMYYNDSLQTLEGLDSLDPYLLGLRIQYNPSLSYCHIPKVCEYLNLYPTVNSISENLGDCETANHVRNACGLMTTQNHNDLKIDVYTKNNTLNIKSPTTIQDIIIYDLSGKIIHQKNNINSGLYQASFIASQPLVVKVKTVGGELLTKKILVN